MANNNQEIKEKADGKTRGIYEVISPGEGGPERIPLTAGSTGILRQKGIAKRHRLALANSTNPDLTEANMQPKARVILMFVYKMMPNNAVTSKNIMSHNEGNSSPNSHEILMFVSKKKPNSAATPKGRLYFSRTKIISTI